MPENPQITLRDSGERAVLMPDPYQPGAHHRLPIERKAEA